MKKLLFRMVQGTLVLLVLLAIGVITLFDREAWRTGRRLSESLQDAHMVTLVEYSGDTEIAHKVAAPDEIVRLRKAVSGWWYPFWPGQGYLSFVPHHRIEIVRSDGSSVTGLVSFVCQQFMIDNETIPAPLPPRINKSLTSFFRSVGMKPKAYDEYKASEIARIARRNLEHEKTK